MKNSRVKRMWALGRIVNGDMITAAYPSTNRSFEGVQTRTKTASQLRARWEGQLENVYRVMIYPTTGCVEVVCLGMDSVDSEAEGNYASTAKLPEWMQGKLAVLKMMKVDPPQTKIEGVGMRIDEDVFWVIKGDTRG